MDIAVLVKYFLFFILCSFTGWLVEEIWVGLRTKKLVNRGFLIGPLCPIYGLGGVFIILFAYHFHAAPALVALASALGCAALEYIASFLLEKMFGARWWDYTAYPFNLHGRICLRYTIAFGLSGLLLVYLAYPAFLTLFELTPSRVVHIIAIIIAIIFAADLITSTFIIKGFRKIKKTGERDDSEDITAYVKKCLAERGPFYRRLNSFDFVIGRVRVLHYKEPTDDLVENKGQNYRLPQNYQFIRRKSRPALFRFGRVWARLHKFYTGTRYVNAEILNATEPCFIYANHTQPIGDILAPVDYCGGRRLRLLAAPANLGLPLIGHFLPDLGALPVPSTIHQLAQLDAAVSHYAKAGAPIIIYPEAHVWPYYTKIRPFTKAAFAYPVKNHAATFVAVTTYQKRKFLRKPRRVIYFAGPFYPDETQPRRKQAEHLRSAVQQAMEKLAKHNNVKYVKYIHDAK